MHGKGQYYFSQIKRNIGNYNRKLGTQAVLPLPVGLHAHVSGIAGSLPRTRLPATQFSFRYKGPDVACASAREAQAPGWLLSPQTVT